MWGVFFSLPAYFFLFLSFKIGLKCRNGYMDQSPLMSLACHSHTATSFVNAPGAHNMCVAQPHQHSTLPIVCVRMASWKEEEEEKEDAATNCKAVRVAGTRAVSYQSSYYLPGQPLINSLI